MSEDRSERTRSGAPRPDGAAAPGGDLDEAPREVGPLEVVDLGDGITQLDTGLAGRPRVTAAYLVAGARPALVECGPARSIGTVLAHLDALGLEPDDLAHLVVSHIHLDHAGGAGALLAAFPRASVAVAEVGAPHLADPARLNASSRRVFGPLFDPIYGDCTPVPADRLRGVVDGDAIDLGGGRALDVVATPGHARHHVAFHDTGTGALFTGDAVGVVLPGMRGVRPATPPPDFDHATATASIERMAARRPTRLLLAHYGDPGPPEDVLTEAGDTLARWVGTAAAVHRVHGTHDDEIDHLATALGAAFDARLLPDDDGRTADVLALLSGLEANAAGLVRYLRTRDAAADTDA